MARAARAAVAPVVVAQLCWELQQATGGLAAAVAGKAATTVMAVVKVAGKATAATATTLAALPSRLYLQLANTIEGVHGREPTAQLVRAAFRDCAWAARLEGASRGEREVPKGNLPIIGIEPMTLALLALGSPTELTTL